MEPFPELDPLEPLPELAPLEPLPELEPVMDLMPHAMAELIPLQEEALAPEGDQNDVHGDGISLILLIFMVLCMVVRRTTS
jgi:hypothetical protein